MRIRTVLAILTSLEALLPVCSEGVKIVIMRIALLTNEYPPHVYGGAGVHVFHLSDELARLDGGRHEIQVLCFGDQNEHSGSKKVQGVQLPVGSAIQDFPHPKFLETLLRNITMVGTLEQADIIHCHTWYTVLAGCLLKQLIGGPLVITTHSLEPQRPWKAEQLGPAYQATTWLEKTAYQNADGIIAVSPSMRTDVHRLYEVPLERIKVIPNGIDVRRYQPTLNEGVLHSYGISPETPFVLFVGRITRQKGILHLVHAIEHLSPGIQVVLCAGAPDTKEIEASIEDEVGQAQTHGRNKIIWVKGWVPSDHLIVLYSHASVLACPSIYEPFGIVNLEAMACETPVVASAVGGIPDVVVHGETGFLVPFDSRGGEQAEPRDPGEFARDLAGAINRLLSSPEKAREMGRQARKRVEEYFTWKRVAQKTFEFYKMLLKEDEGAPPGS